LRLLFRSKTDQEWIDLLGKMDVCCQPVLPLEQALVSEPIRNLNMLRGNYPSSPITLSEKSQVSPGDVPKMGQHTEALLRELGYGDDDVVRLRKLNVI
jgi:crotonobetainyl-CoA:carnitine CoA-transferase CaiB-like acyl-CoA transferase